MGMMADGLGAAAGPAGARQLRRAGHEVAVVERVDRIGCLLRYGIPEFKMEKRHLDRRLDQMRAEGTGFEWGGEAGGGGDAAQLRAGYGADGRARGRDRAPGGAGAAGALRRSAAAITAAVVTVVLPFLLAGLNIVPSGVGAWLLRLTPTAGLAIQQSIPRYPQVTSVVDTVRGYWPLSPYAGFGVLCLWAAAALGLAFVLLRQRDA